MSLFVVILRIVSRIAGELKVIFSKSLIGATIQDSGKREREANNNLYNA